MPHFQCQEHIDLHLLVIPSKPAFAEPQASAYTFWLELNDVAIFIFRFAGMGNLIKVLTRDIDHNAAHFFLDFESKSL